MKLKTFGFFLFGVHGKLNGAFKRTERKLYIYIYIYSVVCFLILCLICSSPGDQLSRGTKRPNTSSALALMDPKRRGDMVERSQQHSSASAGTPKAPLCRPWDRGDLMRRLATFKSMTWFAKPKV